MNEPPHPEGADRIVSDHAADNAGEAMTQDDDQGRCQQVAAMLIATYEELDRLERLLGGATATGPAAAAAQPSPPPPARRW